jgi:hypothetical protein
MNGYILLNARRSVVVVAAPDDDAADDGDDEDDVVALLDVGRIKPELDVLKWNPDDDVVVTRTTIADSVALIIATSAVIWFLL